MMNESEITEVYSAADESEAYFVKNLLEDAGIASQVVNDLLVLPPGETMAPRVWVRHADAPRAGKIIHHWQNEHEKRRDEARVKAARWKCPKCAEEIPADFEICWNCSYPRNPV